MSNVKNEQISVSIQRHELSSGQIMVLEERLLSESGVTHVDTRNCMVTVRFNVTEGRTSTQTKKQIEVVSSYLRKKTGELANELKREKASQRGWGRHDRK